MEKKILFCVIMLININLIIAQKKATSIEINPYLRYDNYPEFLSINEIYRKIYTKQKGLSIGLNINYKIPIKNTSKLLFGLGYYKNTFNNIISKSPTATGSSSHREILVVDPGLTATYTEKYLYNIITVNAGIEREILIKKNRFLIIDVIVNSFLNYSQHYHFDNKIILGKDYYDSKNSSIGISTSLQIGLLVKTVNKISLTPKLLIPVFETQKKDINFPYNLGSGVNPKWLNGIGLGISINYLLPN